MTKILVFGDSIACGYNDYVQGGWVELLRKYFVSKRKDIVIHNSSISGNTSEDIVKRFNEEYSSKNPDIVIFAIGINDSVFYLKDPGHNRVSTEKFNINIRKLWNNAKKKSKVIFIGLTPIEESKLNPMPWIKSLAMSQDSVDKYDKILKDFCKKEGILYIEINLSSEDLDDGLHPNSKGHEKMYEKIREFMLRNKII